MVKGKISKIKSVLLSSLPAIFLIAFLVGTIIYAWTEPTTTPPGGNVPAPINVGDANQVKTGKLGIGAIDTSYSLTLYGSGLKITNTGTQSTLYIEDQSLDPTPFVIDANGNVGIGTASPGAKLEVNGQVKITGGSPGAGKVLTSDANGLATWQEPPGNIPSGGIIMYSGPWNFDETGLGIGSLEGWALCNGNNGTPDLSDRFIMGATNEAGLGATGGSATHSHTIDPPPTNTSGMSCFNASSYINCAYPYGSWNNHRHTVDIPPFNSSEASSLPPYFKLAFIMKL